MPRPISHEQIAEAHRHIDPVFLGTPVVESPSLDKAVGARVIVKDIAEIMRVIDAVLTAEQGALPPERQTGPDETGPAQE